MKLFKAFFVVTLTLSVTMFPVLASASSSFDFTPVATDLSVAYLSKIFGLVDGVLYGTGSQIMGTLFGVFNAAILVIGGIVLIYVLIVSTLNTAHQGEILGQKWNSLWVPIRIAVGMALLLPKASGYCLMQVLIMWIVVQGVGAANKIWDAALMYLARGGVIVQENLPPLKKDGPVGTGKIVLAGNMLQQQVCMEALQAVLYQRHEDLRGKTTDLGTPPALLNGVTIKIQARSDVNNREAGKFALPSHVEGKYSFLNILDGNNKPRGICGSLSWTALSQGQKDILRKNSGDQSWKESWKEWDQFSSGGVRGGDQSSGARKIGDRVVEESSQARRIATTQMFLDLASTTRVIVRNQTHPPTTGSKKKLPLTLGRVDPGDPQLWVSGILDSATPDERVALLRGSELKNAARAYYALMRPTLELLKQSISNNTMFIPQAQKDGWIMAGGYFFNLLMLNQRATAMASDSGTVKIIVYKPPAAISEWLVEALCKKVYDIQDSTSDTIKAACKKKEQKYGDLFLKYATSGGYQGKKEDKLTKLAYYISEASKIEERDTSMGAIQLDLFKSFTPVTFPQKIDLGIGSQGNWLVKPITKALGYAVNGALQSVGGFLNKLIVPLQQFVVALFGRFVNTIINSLSIASAGNPILALAQLGFALMSIAAFIWGVVAIGITAVGFIPLIGQGTAPMALFLLPALLAAVGSMYVAGVTMAFYVPLLPYIIFTMGAIAWFIAIIESMVAGPIVALGIMHPEGSEAFGKAEQAIMLILNIFLRPSMMIIGLIAGIILAYVGTWLLVAGFLKVVTSYIAWIFPGSNAVTGMLSLGIDVSGGAANIAGAIGDLSGSSQGGGMAQDIWRLIAAPQAVMVGALLLPTIAMLGQMILIFIVVMSLLTLLGIFVMMYLQIIQKSFSLIYHIPDKVLRWLSGGLQESLGGEVAGEMVKGVKGGLTSGAEKTAQQMARTREHKKKEPGAQGDGLTMKDKNDLQSGDSKITPDK